MSELTWEIDCRGVKRKFDSAENFLLLDCREADEHAAANIKGAMLVPMSELGDRVGELEPYRQHPVIVHCHMGGRSLRVASWLREQGFSQAQSMAGGIEAWSQEIDPSVPRY